MEDSKCFNDVSQEHAQASHWVGLRAPERVPEPPVRPFAIHLWGIFSHYSGMGIIIAGVH